MKKRKATRATKGGLKTWPMPEGFELPDDVGLLIGNRIHRVKASTRGIAVGGDVTASQVVGEQVIHGDSHVTFGAAPASPAQPQRPAIAPSKRPVSRPSAPVLTRAERDVAGYLGSDVSPGAIAKALDVSAAVVQAHIRSIQSKLGVRSRHAAVAALVRAGIPVDGAR